MTRYLRVLLLSGQIKVVDEAAFKVAYALCELLNPLQQSSSSSTSHWLVLVSSAQSAILSMCLITVQTAIDLLDKDNESILSLSRIKSYLLRTVCNHFILQCPEGQILMVRLLHSKVSFVLNVHEAIKAHTPQENKSVLELYAQIYYSAWRDSTKMKTSNVAANAMGEIQSSIKNALKDLMYNIIHEPCPLTAKSARAVLDGFYVNKKSDDVQLVLDQTYGSLVWTALLCRNSQVRANACGILADTFPLHNTIVTVVPHRCAPNMATLIERSVQALVKLMEDEVPCVRAAGSLATARILSAFWAIFPNKDRKTLISCEYTGRNPFPFFSRSSLVYYVTISFTLTLNNPFDSIQTSLLNTPLTTRRPPSKPQP